MPKPGAGATLDTGHALYGNILHAYPLDENTGLSSTDRKSTKDLTLPSNLWATDTGGETVIRTTVDLAAPLALSSAIVLPGNAARSIMWQGKQAASNNSGMICGDNTNTGDFLWWQGGSGLQFRPTGAGVNTQLGIASTFTTDALYILTYTPTGGTAGNFQLYINAVTNGGTVNEDGRLTINTLGNGYTGGLALIGDLKHFVVFDKALSGAEVTALGDGWNLYSASTPATEYTASLDVSTVALGGQVEITLTPDGDADGITVTLDDNGAGGSFDDATPTFVGSNPAVVLYTAPGTAQTVTIDFADDGGLTDPASENIEVVSGSISLTGPVQHQLFQREGIGAFSGIADIIIEGTATAGDWEASWGGAYVVVLTNHPGGAFTTKLPRQAVGIHTLAMRLVTDTSVNASVSNVKIGDIYVTDGQSNADGRGTNNQVDASGTGSRFYNADGWTALQDPVGNTVNAAGSPWPLVANLIYVNYGIPVAFIPHATGGTSITAHLPISGDFSDLIDQVLDSGNYIIRAGLLHQGETDVGAMTTDEYYGHYILLSAGYRDEFGCKLMPCRLQNSTGLTDADEDEIRAAVDRAYEQDENTEEGPDFEDISSDDAFHPQSDAKILDMAERWVVKLALLYYQAVASGGGRRRRLITVS